MHKVAIVLFALAAFSWNCEARQLSRCELVWELQRQGFPAGQIRDWVCLVEGASNRHTGFVSPPSSTGTRAWGLFQIWDTFWCNNSSLPGKECNVRCIDLITPDITKSSNCAKLIHSRHGFGSWSDWINNCVSQPLPDISHC